SGGPAGGAYAGASSQHHPVSLQLTRDGKRVRTLFIRVNADSCTSPTFNPTVTLEVDPSEAVRLHADGKFSDTSQITGETVVDGKRLDFQAVLKGRVGTTRAAGTIRLFGPVRDAAGNIVDTCDSGVVRWALARGPGVYGGATDQFGAVSVRVDGGRRQVRVFFVDFRVTCGSSTFAYSIRHAVRAPVRRDGSFSKRGLSGIPIKTPEGATITGRFALDGKVGSRQASGTYRASGTLRQPDGSRLSCDTGAVKWTARSA
ncbi:MAG: hypothetical protein ACJ76V_06025, partial [Thermoleophilaceae bacterium]